MNRPFRSNEEGALFRWHSQIINRTRKEHHTHCEPKSGYAWFKTFKSFKPFKMSEKQSGAVERSAAIEHLERFDQLHCWLPIARDRSGLVLGNCRHESSVIRVLPSCRSAIGFC